ncbi:MAG TPA: AGE family epimerase/isomerase [Xanthobacteraceae bacterium]|nr:AGE family epimerase/isomerase [Xanthobacteraceae bacterium]
MAASDALKALSQAAAEAEQWLFESAAPLWATVGFRSDGMFAEQIGLDGKALALPGRLRVQARQIYAFCELGRLGWTGNWRNCAERAVGHLLERGRRSDGLFIHTFSAEGAPLDARADLYDHAFVLFSLGHAARALNRDDLLAVARSTADKLMAWRHPEGGFREGEVDGPPRRQNPHMHLLEAALALWQASSDVFWKDLASEIATLCRDRFIDSGTGALREYFTEDWRPVPGADGDLVEPGHCFEWAWLFERLDACGIADGAAAKGGLVSFARHYGLDAGRGVAINAVSVNGAVASADARLWPQTERMKAALARFRRTGAECEAQEAVAGFRGLRKYFDTPVKGLWRDVLKSAGRFVEQPAPASSFYHIVCGLAELIDTGGPFRSRPCGPCDDAW